MVFLRALMDLRVTRGCLGNKEVKWVLGKNKRLTQTASISFTFLKSHHFIEIKQLLRFVNICCVLHYYFKNHTIFVIRKKEKWHGSALFYRETLVNKEILEWKDQLVKRSRDTMLVRRHGGVMEHFKKWKITTPRSQNIEVLSCVLLIGIPHGTHQAHAKIRTRKQGSVMVNTLYS